LATAFLSGCVPGPVDWPVFPALSPVWLALPWLVAGPVGSPDEVVAVAAEGDAGESLPCAWAKAGPAKQIMAAMK
jgi:hypothetical protein